MHGNSTALVVRDSAQTLEQLAERANREHSATENDLWSAFGHAVACGDALLEARELVGGDRWYDWVAANLNMRGASAARYMRLSYYKQQLPEELFRPYVDGNGSTRAPSVNRAMEYIRGLPPIYDETRYRQIPQWKRAEVIRLRKQGLSAREIGKLLGIGKNTAVCIYDPEYAKRAKELRNRAKRKQLAATRALKEQETRAGRDRAAAERNDALGEAYSILRRSMLPIANRAFMQAGSKEERGALDEAIAHLHRAEDAIAKALKVPS